MTRTRHAEIFGTALDIIFCLVILFILAYFLKRTVFRVILIVIGVLNIVFVLWFGLFFDAWLTNRSVVCQYELKRDGLKIKVYPDFYYMGEDVEYDDVRNWVQQCEAAKGRSINIGDTAIINELYSHEENQAKYFILESQNGKFSSFRMTESGLTEQQIPSVRHKGKMYQVLKGKAYCLYP